MRPDRRKSFEEVCSEIGIERSLVVELVEREWIRPVEAGQLDEEDVARARLIIELRREFGVNDEGIPIILHLLDQLYAVRAAYISRARAGLAPRSH